MALGHGLPSTVGMKVELLRIYILPVFLLRPFITFLSFNLQMLIDEELISSCRLIPHKENKVKNVPPSV